MGKSFRGRSLASSVRSSQDDSAPVLIPQTDSYAKVVESRGKGQFLVSLPTTTTTVTDTPVTLLAYMPPKFRNALWIRRGSFVIIRKYEEGINESNELVHVLSVEQIKEIKREGKWPKDFCTVIEESECEESGESEGCEDSEGCGESEECEESE